MADMPVLMCPERLAAGYRCPERRVGPIDEALRDQDSTGAGVVCICEVRCGPGLS